MPVIIPLKKAFCEIVDIITGWSLAWELIRQRDLCWIESSRSKYSQIFLDYFVSSLDSHSILMDFFIDWLNLLRKHLIFARNCMLSTKEEIQFLNKNFLTIKIYFFKYRFLDKPQDAEEYLPWSVKIYSIFFYENIQWYLIFVYVSYFFPFVKWVLNIFI